MVADNGSRTGDLFFTCDPPCLIRGKTGAACEPFEAEYPVNLVDQPQFETFPHRHSLLRCESLGRSSPRNIAPACQILQRPINGIGAAFARLRAIPALLRSRQTAFSAGLPPPCKSDDAGRNPRRSRPRATCSLQLPLSSAMNSWVRPLSFYEGIMLRIAKSSLRTPGRRRAKAAASGSECS